MNVTCCAVALSVSKPDSGKSAGNPGIMIHESCVISDSPDEDDYRASLTAIAD